MIAFARALPGVFVVFAGGRAMARGVVKWFDPKKGYGFIMQEGAPDVFVHWRNIESGEDFKTLEDGETVEFEIIEGAKGLAAENVVRIS